MSVRAKFYITTVAPSHGGKGGNVKLTPVYSSDPNHENKTFWDATPNGSIEMYIQNQAAFDFFTEKMGGEYYVDFTRAE